MKTSLLLGSAALASVMAADAFAYDGARTWYISGAVGANWAEDENFVVFTTTFFGASSTVVGEIDYDTGWALGGAVGYRFEKPWRAEVELAGRWNDFDGVGSGTFFSGAVSGDVNAVSLMGNVAYDARLSDRWNLTLGAGIGVVWVDLEGNYVFTSTFTTVTGTFDDDDSGFAYQLIGGVSYEAGAQTDVFLEYRYFASNDVELRNSSGSGYDDYTAHTLWIGLRHYFQPAPAAEPVMEEPEVKTFIVFFDFNKSNLTAEAKETIAEAAAAYAATGSVHILVVGHTDTVGSAGYNQGLSERRAGSVKAELVRDGVPSGSISTEGRGFSEPMVPTGPGVKEPQNRRAVIELQ